MLNGREWIDGMELSHCAAAADLADQLGLGLDVRGALQHTFERWDGKGPGKVSGEQIPLSARLVGLADIVEVVRPSGWHRGGGRRR